MDAFYKSILPYEGYVPDKSLQIEGEIQNLNSEIQHWKNEEKKATDFLQHGYLQMHKDLFRNSIEPLLLDDIPIPENMKYYENKKTKYHKDIVVLKGNFKARRQTIYDPNTMTYTMISSIEPRYITCPKCGVKYSTKKKKTEDEEPTFLKHYETCIDYKKKAECPRCKKIFKNMRSMQAHKAKKICNK